MITIQPWLTRTAGQIEKKYGIENGLAYIRTDKAYVDIDNSLEVYEYMHNYNFTPKHIQMLFTITYKEEVIIGYDVPNALDLWSTYLAAIEDVLMFGSSKRQYGVDANIVEFQSQDSKLLYFSIYYELDPSVKYVDVKLPYKEFLYALVGAVRHFYNRMNDDYGKEIGNEGTNERIEHALQRIAALT